MDLKIKFTEEDAALLAMVQGPIWPNGCEHEEGTYVASFEIFNFKQNKIDKYDLYLFQDRGSKCQHVCIRYGKEGSEYISPGDLGGFLARSDGVYEPYATAVRILLHYGNVEWSKK